MSKESFKKFVSKHPSLIKYVQNDQMTWQKFYEIYDLYGESIDAWGSYLEVGDTKSTSTLLGDTSLKEIFNAMKKIDMESLQKGVDGLQKAVALIQDIVFTKQSNKTPTYEKRPMYKYFED